MTDKNKKSKKSDVSYAYDTLKIGRAPINLKNENDTIEFLLSSIPESVKIRAEQSFEHLKNISEIQNKQIEKTRQLKEKANKFNNELERADFDSDMGVLEFRDNIKDIYPHKKNMWLEFAGHAVKKPDNIDGLDDLVDVLKILTRREIEKNRDLFNKENTTNSNKRWSLKNIYGLCDMYDSLVNWRRPVKIINHFRRGFVNQAVNALSEVMVTGKYDNKHGSPTIRQMVDNIKHEETEIKRKEKTDEISRMVEELSSEQIQEAIELIKNKKNKDNLPNKKPSI